MKVLLALAVLATSVTALAGSDIYDVMYLPSAGTTYGISSLELLDRTIEPKGTSDIENSGYKFTQTIGHSFSDRFSLNAQLNYTDLKTEFSGFPSTKLTGVSDPTIEARFRTMDENFRWDIIGGALISVGDSEIKSDGDTDNLQGGHSAYVGTQFGQKTESMQWAVLGQYTHFFEQTFEDKSTDTKIDDDAHDSLLVRGDLLNKLAEKSYIRSHLQADFTQGYDDEDGEEAAAPRTTYEIGAEYQHLFSKDFLLRAGVDYQTVNVDSAHIDSATAWIWRLAANYQF